MRSFSFIRHGETDWNKDFVLQGQNDVPLNENGINQAKERAKTLSLDGFTEIFSSPLQRAWKTAEIIKDTSGKDLNLIPVPELMECKSEESARYIFGLKDIDHLPSFEKVKDEKETAEEFIDRVRTGLTRVFEASKDKKPLIVAHGGVCAALCLILDLEFFRTPNCCLVDFDFDGKDYTAKFHK